MKKTIIGEASERYGDGNVWIDENGKIQTDLRWIFKRKPEEVHYYGKGKNYVPPVQSKYPVLGEEEEPEDASLADEGIIPDLVYTYDDVNKSMRWYDEVGSKIIAKSEKKKWWRQLFDSIWIFGIIVAYIVGLCFLIL